MSSLTVEPLIVRIASAFLVLGAALMFTGASIPFLSEIGAEAWQGTPDQVVSAVAKGPAAWRWANGLIAVAAVMTSLGLTGFVIVANSGRLPASAGVIAFAIGATLDVTARIINMTITPWIAGQSSASTFIQLHNGFYRVSEGLIRGFILISFVAIILLGVAALQQQVAWLGITLIVFGLLGFVFEIVGLAIPAIAYVGTAGIGIWMLVTPLSTLE